MGKDYGWKRFWCPREGSYSLADNGFLVDPEGKYGKEFNPDLVTFDQLHEIPCLALLGEPGIGKSRTMHSNAATAKAVAHGGKSIHLDLRQFGSEDRLLRSLFESDVFCDWQNGQHDLHIFLDSLDECLLRIDNVASLLADEIPKCPTARLKLRIACRTASWPSILERVLSEAYGDERFGVFELAPLRRIDVEKAGTVAGVVEVDQLVRRIEELGVVSFAIKPITLNFLLSTYQRNGDIPASAATLYESGCLILCEEQNESRRASGRRGILSPSERLAVASRIAAATQLGNRFAVWTGSSAAPPPQEDVPLDDLTGAIEFEQRQLTVTIQALRETLDTGLFSSRGSERLGWAHQTYAEFLTARYCNEMPIQQLRSILFHPRRKRVIPQLREVASWIALKNMELFREIAENDPEVLLGISASALSDSQRAATTSGLLKSCEQSQVLHLKAEISSALRNLAYPGLSAQISKVLLDKTRQPSARHLVIDIARRCKIADLADDLATIALDQSEPVQLREPAAFTVSEIGSPEARIRLRPLAEASAANDVREECKGAALRALWPGLIASDELFRHLTPRRDSSLYGLYDDFLSHSVLPHLKPADVPSALQWYAVQQHHQIGSFEDLLQGILSLAWKHVEHDGVAKLLAETLAQRISAQMPISEGNSPCRIESSIPADSVRRRCLLKELLPLLGNHELVALFFPLTLVVPEDIDWLIARVLNEESPSSLKLEADAVCRLACCWEREAVDSVWRACQRSTVLADSCKHLFLPVSLDSQDAKYLRQAASPPQRWQAPPLTPPPAERIRKQLELSESGEADAWLSVTREMSLEPTSTHYAHHAEMDMPSLPGWTGSDESTRERILRAGRTFLERSPFRDLDWFRGTGVPNGAIAGNNALILLYVADQEYLKRQTASFWTPWIPAILSDMHFVTDKSKVPIFLLRMAYAAVPEEVTRRLLQIMDADSERHGYFLCSERVDAILDSRLASALTAKMREDILKPEALRGLLSFLLGKGVDEARKWAEAKATSATTDVDTLVAIASALLTQTPDVGWSAIWPLMERDVAFGRALLEETSFADPTHASFTRGLTDVQVGQLYIWTVGQYPYQETADVGYRMMSPHDSIRFLRDGALEQLKKRASFSACDCLATAIIRFPQYSWLRYHLDEAEALACASTWQALPVPNLLQVCSDPSRRSVESSSQLLEVICESLDRLQVLLHAELPAVRDLWNSKNGEAWPKEEEDVSDYIARHFKADLIRRGIVVNREVQIRKGQPGEMPGQKTDIHVDANVPGTRAELYGPVSVIVEVKGNWNAGLMEDLERQLRDRYLQNNPCGTGLYLVAYFSAKTWSKDDSRRGKAAAVTAEELRRSLESQAASLSGALHLKSYILDATLGSTAAQP